MNEESNEFLNKFERFVNIQNRRNEVLENLQNFLPAPPIDHNQSIILLKDSIFHLSNCIVLSSVIIGLAIIFHKII